VVSGVIAEKPVPETPIRERRPVADELTVFRIELRAAVDLSAVHKDREEQHDPLPVAPTRWQTWDLWRAICFGFVPKHASRVVAIEETPPERQDGSKAEQPYEG
jgi:hypothetical protein